MARGPYRLPSSVRRLRALVAFAEGDRRAPALAGVADLDRLTGDAIAAFRALTPEQTERLRADLRSCLRALGGADVSGQRPIHVTLHPLRVGARLRLDVSGTPRDVVRYLGISLAEQIGPDRLRVCPAPDCGRAFVKIGRREFCSTRCQRRVFFSRYDPFRARARRGQASSERRSRHGSTTRARRRLDYAAT